MSLKYDPKNDPIVLNSDIEQSLEEEKKKLKLAITAFKDILNWSENLEDAKGLARYILSIIE
jgi:hypothetical protein